MAWITKTTLTPGWDAGARSVALLEGDGAYSFSVGPATGIVCGLNSADNDAGYHELDHSFWIEAGTYRIQEGDLAKTVSLTYANSEAIFKIERIGTVVRYYVDAVLVYTSDTSSIGTVFLDCSLYSYLDAIYLGDLDTTSATYNTVTVTAEFTPLIAASSDSEDVAFVTTQLKELVATLNGDAVPSVAAQFLPLAVTTSVSSEPRIVAEFLPLQAKVDSTELPNIATIYAEFAPLFSWSDTDFPTITAEFLPLNAFGVDTGDGIVTASLQPLQATPMAGLSTYFSMQWPIWAGVIPVRNRVAFTIPAPELDITGTVHTSRIEFIIPAPTISAYGGGITTFTIPAPTLAIAGTTQQLARVEFEIPAPELAMTALVGDTGRVAFTLPAPTLKAYSGGRVSFTLPAPVVTVAGTTEILARVALHIPSPVVAMAGEVYGLARVAFEIPAPILAVGRGNWVEFEIPAPLVAVSATYVGTTTQAAEEVTYAVNLNTGAVTQLLLGGFDKLVTAHGRLYGLKDGALTRLEGNVDGTETLIPATIRFAANTFDTNNVKRISNVYWSTRESDGITMDLIADERTVWRYQTTTDTAPAFGTHKIKTGLGVVFHTAGIVLRNRDGGTLDIGGGEFIVHPLSRKPR